MMQLQAPPQLEPMQDPAAPPLVSSDAGPTPPIGPMICPHCHQGRMIFILQLIRQQAMGP
jgi:hypothetical protein